MATAKDSELKRVGRFGLVGILNTVVDFVLFNILRLLLATTVASIISGTVAMINSYIFNQRFTFKSKHVTRSRMLAFFGLTAFGLYVIRPAVIYIFTSLWTWPGNFAYSVSSTIGLPFSQNFVSDNLALVAAIAVVLFYNYLTYKQWVFGK